MAQKKEEAAETPVAAKQAAPQAQQKDFDMTLEEFCARLSKSDRRVELIAGFHATEAKSGRHKRREAEFRTRFSAFVNQPA